MLWNLIYEFFVRYIFGGYLGEDSYYANLAYSFFIEDDQTFEDGFVSTNYTLFKTGLFDRDGSSVYMSLGNYLSLIATIITIVGIVILCIWFIKKIIQIIFRLFTANGAF